MLYKLKTKTHSAFYKVKGYTFLPARRNASAGISCHRVSVVLSVTHRYCIKTAKHKIKQIYFSDANSRWWTTPNSFMHLRNLLSQRLKI